jgi:glutathione S-transferase
MATALPKLRYYYLDKRVKGECVRLALVVGGIEFDDVRLSYEEVHELRQAGRLPFSQVPALQIGDDPTLYAQSQALLRWAGRAAGLYPEAHQLRIDAVTDTIVELYEHIVKVGYGSAMTRHPETGRPMVALSAMQRMQVAQHCGDVLFPTRFRQLEKQVVSMGETGVDAQEQQPRSQYFCGPHLTIADLSLYVLASAILDGAWAGNGVDPEVLDDCPKLLRVVELVAEHPRVKEWNDAHPCSWFG